MDNTEIKKLIIITSPLFVRNYIKTDAFDKIVDKNTYIACTDDLDNKDAIINRHNFVGAFGMNKVNKILFKFIFLLLMYSNRKINKGFYFYFKIQNTTIYYKSLRLKAKIASWCSNTLCQSIAISVLELFRPFFQPKKLFSFVLIVLIDSLGLTKKVIKFYKFILPENKELTSMINKVDPDLILIPSGGLDPYTNDVLFTSDRNNQIKTMLLIDNWDNLCSKSRFIFNPDYLCVWGDQAKGHAEMYHDYDMSKVFLAGSPRFDYYYKYLNNIRALKGKYDDVLNFPYILFAGCWPAFDEIAVLEILDGLIDEYKDLLPNGCKILYRPHPWGENYDKLDYLQSKGLKNIAIDPQMSKKSRHDDYKKRTEFQPELDYYPVLLDNSEFVICPLSSVTIEASIMNKKVLALAHDDGISLQNPLMMYQNSDYFDRFDDMTNLMLLHDLSNLGKQFHYILVSSMPINSKALSYYIVNDDQLYPERIENICNQVYSREGWV